MNNNFEEERSIQRMIPAMQAELDRLFALDGMAEAHEYSVACHRSKIEELKARDDYAAFYAELTSERMETLSRLPLHLWSRDLHRGSGGDPRTKLSDWIIRKVTSFNPPIHQPNPGDRC